MDTFINLLTKNEELQKIGRDKLKERRKLIFDLIFRIVFAKVNNSMLFQDRLVFGLKLTQIKLNKDQFFDNLMRGASILKSSISENILRGKLNKNQLKSLEDIQNKQVEFSEILAHIDKNEDVWVQFIDSPKPEENIPQGYEPVQFISEEQQMQSEEKELNQIFREIILIKVFRPDRFTIAVNKLVDHVLGNNFMQEQQLNLQKVVKEEVGAKSPILMCSAPGFDPSFKIEQLAKQLDIRLLTVAIGSAEGFEQADKSISQASKNGIWVMLKNVHLAPSWLIELEKNIHKLNPHSNFRLFLTMEFNPKVPSTLIRQSFVLVFEPPDGIKASLKRTYNTLFTQARTDKLPRERSRLHFLLAWLHAILLERLRYTPIGYSKVYELNEADQRCALDLIDEHVDSLGTERTNIDPEKLPWQAIRTILTENLYGGKIDNEYDRKILISLVNHLFNSSSFDNKYVDLNFIRENGRRLFYQKDQ